MSAISCLVYDTHLLTPLVNDPHIIFSHHVTVQVDFPLVHNQSKYNPQLDLLVQFLLQFGMWARISNTISFIFSVLALSMKTIILA